MSKKKSKKKTIKFDHQNFHGDEAAYVEIQRGGVGPFVRMGDLAKYGEAAFTMTPAELSSDDKRVSAEVAEDAAEKARVRSEAMTKAAVDIEEEMISDGRGFTVKTPDGRTMAFDDWDPDEESRNAMVAAQNAPLDARQQAMADMIAGDAAEKARIMAELGAAKE